MCPLNAKCINTPGSYFCTCQPGYVSSNGWLNFTDQEVKCRGEQRVLWTSLEKCISLFPLGCLIFSSSLQILMSVSKIHHHVVPILSALMPWAPTVVAALWAFIPIRKALGNMATSAANVIISLCVLAMEYVSCFGCKILVVPNLWILFILSRHPHILPSFIHSFAHSLIHSFKKLFLEHLLIC